MGCTSSKSVDNAPASPAKSYPSSQSQFGAYPDLDTLFEAVEKIKTSEPGNRCTKYLDKTYMKSLSPSDLKTFWQCVCTGIDNPDSSMGCYAMTPEDYSKFKPFFSKVIGDYHKDDAACNMTHVNDWDASSVGEGGVLDLSKLGCTDEISMRVRVGRNLKGFNLPGAMDKAERIKFEKAMLKSFEALIAKFGGKINSITPDFGDGEANPNKISSDEYDALVKKHVMFKDMDADPYLKSAGISSDWPYGRGCWQSDDGKKIMCVCCSTNTVFSPFAPRHLPFLCVLILSLVCCLQLVRRGRPTAHHGDEERVPDQ